MEYRITREEDSLQHYGIPGMKWGRRKNRQGVDYQGGTAVKYNVKGASKQSRRKRTLRKNMTNAQRRQSNKQIRGSVAGNVVGNIAANVISRKTGKPLPVPLGTIGSLAGVGVASLKNSTNANVGRTMVMTGLLGTMGASTVYDHTRF